MGAPFSLFPFAVISPSTPLFEFESVEAEVCAVSNCY